MNLWKGCGGLVGLVLCTNYHLTFTHWVWPLSSHRQINDIVIIIMISLAWVLGIAPYNKLLECWYQMHMVIEVMFSLEQWWCWCVDNSGGRLLCNLLTFWLLHLAAATARGVSGLPIMTGWMRSSGPAFGFCLFSFREIAVAPCGISGVWCPRHIDRCSWLVRRRSSSH